MVLTHDERHELLTIAHDAIVGALTGTHHQQIRSTGDNLQQQSGAFVTIRSQGELRGCIGYIESERPLAETIAEVAVKAATEDPRFPPMTFAEFASASIEISILSPLKRVAGPDDIIVGTHGVVVVLGMRRGLLLPQVAIEHRFDSEAFLSAAMRKGGIPSSMSRLPEVEIYVFEAEVVQETDDLH